MTPIPQPRQYSAPVVRPLSESNFYHVYLCVRGVKVRCRKPDFHMIKLKRYPINALDKSEAQRLGFEAFQKNIKSASEAWLSYHYVHEHNGIESQAMMSDIKEALQPQ